jgi:hypothetical protein
VIEIVISASSPFPNGTLEQLDGGGPWPMDATDDRGTPL